MQTLIIGFCSGLALVIFGVICYSITTNKIIKDQELTIDELLRDNDRLRLEKKYLEKERDNFKRLAYPVARDPAKDTAITLKVLRQDSVGDLFKEW